MLNLNTDTVFTTSLSIAIRWINIKPRIWKICLFLNYIIIQKLFNKLLTLMFPLLTSDWFTFAYLMMSSITSPIANFWLVHICLPPSPQSWWPWWFLTKSLVTMTVTHQGGLHMGDNMMISSFKLSTVEYNDNTIYPSLHTVQYPW